MLGELVTTAASILEGEGQLGRAKYKLSVIHAERDMHIDSDSCRANALSIRDRLRPEMKGSVLTEESFKELCPWMLW